MPPEDLHAIELLSRVTYGRVATSMRALPFLALARHIVVDGGVVLRMHAGFAHHQACDGSVVSYGADNFNSPDPRLWSVQFTGTAQVVEPTTEELELFGPGPHCVDGEVFDPVYLRIEPQFITVHSLAGNGNPDRLYQPAL
ncbi:MULTISPECIES: pyridoxamine 5'-phosphate oxidase family protein [unclassified Streptomyces]|uniref:pyridoxamine 5'-phosphate oxidase family protein n=1 Tax=unclassified Streptomyces TaxID=2593676 RepID=UPI0006ADD2FB|nr:MULTISPECIES: pyridoxamine 5'-phosphate oxidase family protein [unclassified Streptomyces]KOU87327.1 Lpp-LpqN domain-containing protein [Streptomyces sp. XY58]KOV07579.1 Lpp-LpqN domain-containing protein [Streptomyces sp. XY37]KOV48117.1 Lpp-LpqN domain-containing protein [Streptomyces sp. MMG1064]